MAGAISRLTANMVSEKKCSHDSPTTQVFDNTDGWPQPGKLADWEKRNGVNLSADALGVRAGSQIRKARIPVRLLPEQIGGCGAKFGGDTTRLGGR